jgi:hypothetical protein
LRILSTLSSSRGKYCRCRATWGPGNRLHQSAAHNCPGYRVDRLTCGSKQLILSFTSPRVPHSELAMVSPNRQWPDVFHGSVRCNRLLAC